MHRIVPPLTVATLAALLVAAPASGKGDVRARIEGPVRCDAASGSVITVAWRLASVERGKREPFGAGGVFVRLVGEARGRPMSKARARAMGRGRYTADVRVPRGGIRRLQIGLDGIRRIADRTEPAPIYFPIENDPCRG
jgi:hypothetical protein